MPGIFFWWPFTVVVYIVQLLPGPVVVKKISRYIPLDWPKRFFRCIKKHRALICFDHVWLVLQVVGTFLKDAAMFELLQEAISTSVRVARACLNYLNMSSQQGLAGQFGKVFVQTRQWKKKKKNCTYNLEIERMSLSKHIHIYCTHWFMPLDYLDSKWR